MYYPERKNVPKLALSGNACFRGNPEDQEETLTSERKSFRASGTILHVVLAVAFMAALLLTGDIVYADTISTPVKIGESSVYDRPTLGIPRWKGYMPESDVNRFYASYTNSARSYNQLAITTDGGETWSTNNIQIEPAGYLNMHASLFGLNGDLYATWPGRDHVTFRKFEGPIRDNDDGGPLVPIEGTTVYYRSNLMVENTGRIWLFTRLSYDDPAENVLFNYSDDDGASWTRGTAYATNSDMIRFGSMPYVNGNPALVVLYLNDRRGYEYYLWNGERFEAKPDHSIFPGNVGMSRAFTHNVVNDTTFHLVFGLDGELHHVWKHFNNGTGSWNHEIIENSPTTESMDWSPISTVRGDDLYIFYTKKSTTSDNSSMVYEMKWSQESQSWTDPVLVSTDGANSYDRDPNTCFKVPDNASYIPVYWTRGNGPFEIYFSKVIVDNDPGTGDEPITINCPSGTADFSGYAPVEACLPLAISNATKVIVDGGTWNNGTLCITAETSGLYSPTVTAMNNSDTVQCTIPIRVEILSRVSIDCPENTAYFNGCGPVEVCLPLEISNAAEISVNGGTWQNGSVCITADTSGLYTPTVTAVNDNSSAECIVSIQVDVLPEVIIDCPPDTVELTANKPSALSVSLPIYNEDEVQLSGAIWSDDRFTFYADTSGIYSYDLTALNSCGETACKIVADVELIPDVDLYLTDQDITTSESNVSVGDTINILAEIFNQAGSSDAANIAVRFLNGDPGTNGIQIGDDQLIENLAGGASATAMVQYIAEEPISLDVHVVIDPEDQIFEISESNNTAATSIDIAPADNYYDVYGTVMNGQQPLNGAVVNLLNSIGNISRTEVTDVNGNYLFDSLIAGIYSVELELPLGYESSESTLSTIEITDSDLNIDFDLNSVASGELTDFWWWKYLLEDIRDGQPYVTYTKEDVDKFGGMIYENFYDRPDEFAIKIEDVTYTGNPPAPLTFDDLANMWLVVDDLSNAGKIRRHLISNMLDIVAGRLDQHAIATRDGATVSQVLLYYSRQYLEGNVNDWTIWYYLFLMQRSTLIPAGIIPLSTPNITFKGVNEDNGEILPDRFSLKQNHPNPFNPSTLIEYTLPRASSVELEIYNVSGQLVERLVDGMQEAGTYSVKWNASAYSSGVYFYRFSAGDDVETKKMLYIK